MSVFQPGLPARLSMAGWERGEDGGESGTGLLDPPLLYPTQVYMDLMDGCVDGIQGDFEV